MDRKAAKGIADLLNATAVSLENYELVENRPARKLSGFHLWADGKPCLGAFHLTARSGRSLWIALIDWHVNGDYYVILMPSSRTKVLAELHELQALDGDLLLKWNYRPVKRDGRNAERTAYFTEAFQSTEVCIAFPASSDDVDDFLTELFLLASSREKADKLDPERPVARTGFVEGKRKEKLHKKRERDPELVRLAKQLAMDRDGHLKCSCCGFDFHEKYGEIGKGFIEAHHTKPLSSLSDAGEIVRVEDLALVCSNCHSMLHRRRPWLQMGELAELIG